MAKGQRETGGHFMYLTNIFYLPYVVKTTC